jgi:hypothetical protein
MSTFTQVPVMFSWYIHLHKHVKVVLHYSNPLLFIVNEIIYKMKYMLQN